MWDRGLRVRNITFINFQYPSTQAIYGPVVTGRCSANCGGIGYLFEIFVVPLLFFV